MNKPTEEELSEGGGSMKKIDLEAHFVTEDYLEHLRARKEAEEAKQKEKLRGQLLSSVISAQEEERKRIARELHDELGQTLTGLIMSIESSENMTSPEQSACAPPLGH